ncbi:MAG: hypothetical protein UV54_C0039G0003 [Candidatus Beckwithbacteria bacterium GW2011_GWA2_43_10]|uniref:Transposase IS200-like domain-containing protein n=1 Tax=Candidatus Beckwithbacteria bacterium GW2011_GWA2_43_10 TaxID=1618369 RepID=A0A0G1C150_9BACT|nr:MAG: hypothetical protein UV54_C0039G0003 [Candidatus Beckwithbacteria bacterium GW2011_GWA2_43_10]
MPRRIVPLVTEEIYHVFNRGIDRRPTFLSKREYERAIKLTNYYRFRELPGKYSKFITLPIDQQKQIFQQLEKENNKRVEILTLCLMPNHFHFLLKQTADNGISKFISDWQNSYTRFHNLRHERTGPLFNDQFKAVHIESEEQLLHVSRYIHLNPYSGQVINSLADLVEYPWSSLSQFFNQEKSGLCETELILSNFSKSGYKKFIFDQADYQRQLEKIKHLLFP